jgi:hypothetical protein
MRRPDVGVTAVIQQPEEEFLIIEDEAVLPVSSFL